jgi:hypothetical protein
MVRIELGKRDFIWIGLFVILLGVGFGYAWNGNTPNIMGHSAGEISGVCLTDGTGCDAMRAHIDNSISVVSTLTSSGYANTSCRWYDGKICPTIVETGEQYVMAGYDTLQVRCCGSSSPLCEPYDWTTYNTYCGASCAGVECGSVNGVWKYDQRKVLSDGSCKMEQRTIDGTYCAKSCGGCPSGFSCNSGTCVDFGGLH